MPTASTATVKQAAKPKTKVEDLSFYKSRIGYINKTFQKGLNVPPVLIEKRAADRTTEVIRKYWTYQEEIKAAHYEMLKCCGATTTANNKGTASLLVLDKEKFNSQAELIQNNTKQLQQLESAIRKLDSLINRDQDPDQDEFLYDLIDHAGALARARPRHETQIKNLVAGFLSRSTVSIEETMANPDLLRKKAEYEAEISKAEAELNSFRGSR